MKFSDSLISPLDQPEQKECSVLFCSVSLDQPFACCVWKCHTKTQEGRFIVSKLFYILGIAKSIPCFSAINTIICWHSCHDRWYGNQKKCLHIILWREKVNTCICLRVYVYVCMFTCICLRPFNIDIIIIFITMK